jgi:hypothetical protein
VNYLPEIVFTKPHLQFLNRQLQFLEPQGQSQLPRLDCQVQWLTILQTS